MTLDEAIEHAQKTDPQIAEWLQVLKNAPSTFAVWLRQQADACGPVRAATLREVAACVQSGTSFRLTFPKK